MCVYERHRMRHADTAAKKMAKHSNPVMNAKPKQGKSRTAAEKEIPEHSRWASHIFREALDNATDAIGMSTPEGRHYYQNKAFTDLFGDIGEDPPATSYCNETIGREVFRTIMAGGSWTGEVTMYARDRRVVTVLLRAYANKDEEGRIVSLVGIHTDVTERKTLQHQLRKTLSDWTTTLDSVSDAIWILDPDQRILRSNRAAAAMFGKDLDAIVGCRCWEVVHGTVSPVPECPFERMRRTLCRESMELPIGEKWYEITVDPVLDESGRLASAVHIVRDITHHKHSEELIRASDEQLRVLSNSLPSGLVYQIDSGPDGKARRFAYISDGVEKLHELTASAVRQDPMLIYSQVEEEDLRLVAEREAEAARTMTPFHTEVRVTLPSGQKCWRLFTSAPRRISDGRLIWDGIELDITELKRAEVALRDSENRLRSIIDTAPYGAHLYELDAENRLIFVGYNSSAERILGIHHAPFVGKPIAEVFPPLAATDIPGRYAEVAATGRTFETEQVEYDHGGIRGAFEVHTVQIAPRRIVVFFRDITARKRMEEALATERNLYLDLVNSQPAGVYRLRIAAQKPWKEGEWVGKVETHYKLEMVSDRFCQILGASRTQCEASASIVVERIHPEDKQDFVRRNVHALQTLEPFEWEGRILCQGQTRWVHFESVSRCMQNGDVVWTGVLLDISELKKAEDIQRRVSALESLGTVAGGLAHDFNNLLMGVFGYIELAQYHLPPDHPARAALTTAHRAMDNAKRLTARLLTFAKGGSPVLGSINLGETICDTVCFHLSGSNVAAQFDIPADLWPAKADKGQIAEVISNLTVNAKEAMPTGGTFHVTARNIPDIHIPSAPKLRGSYVQLILRDEGTGIPANLIQRIFDPYFTTKQAGSGLGLAIVYGIITKHNGHIAVESVPEIGTTFTLYLPADITEHPATGTALFPLPDTLPRGSGSILLMDDEEEVRNITSLMITQLGYTVETARDGREAVAKYREAMHRGAPFRVTILDLTIPGGMGGQDAVRELLALDPSAKVVVASGYSSDPVLANFSQYGFSARLEKPFFLRELGNTLAHVTRQGTEN